MKNCLTQGVVSVYFIEINQNHLLFLLLYFLFTGQILWVYFQSPWIEFPPVKIISFIHVAKDSGSLQVLILVNISEVVNTSDHFFLLEACVLLSYLPLLSPGFHLIYQVVPIQAHPPLPSSMCSLPQDQPWPELLFIYTKSLCKFTPLCDLIYMLFIQL